MIEINFAIHMKFIVLNSKRVVLLNSAGFNLKMWFYNFSLQLAPSLSQCTYFFFVLAKMWGWEVFFIFFSSLTFDPFVNNNTQRNPNHTDKWSLSIVYNLTNKKRNKYYIESERVYSLTIQICAKYKQNKKWAEMSLYKAR